MKTAINTLSILQKNDIFTHLVEKNDDFLHRHDYYEIFYITSGNIQHFLNGTIYELTVGNIVLLKPDDEHKFIRNADTECSHRDIIITENLFKTVCEYISPDAFDILINTGDETILSLDYQQIQYFELLSNKFGIAGLSGNQSRNILSKQIATTILFAFYDLLFEKNLQNGKQPIWLNEIISRMHELKYIKKGLNFILQDTHYNKVYIARLFKKFTNTTMTTYLNRMRLEYASVFLQTTSLTVQEIINKVGFSSTTFFYNSFKQKYNCSPHIFRKTSNPAIKN